MKKITAFGMVDKGSLKIFNEEVYLQQIRELGFVNHCKIELEYGNKRTIDQNAYLWGAIVPAFQTRLNQEGYDFSPSECYKWLENKFCCGEKYSEKTGEIMEYTMPLKELSTDQFEEIVVTKMRNWIHVRLGSYVKLPHEYYRMPLHVYDKWKRGEITYTEAMKHKENEFFHV